MIALLIAIFIFVNSIAFTIGGIWLACKGILMIIDGRMGSEERPGLLIMESVDVFLLALVFLLFAIGIIKLFIPDAPQFVKVKNLHWLKINNFTDLKLLLWEAVLTTLVVFFVTNYVHAQGHSDWKILILPVSILLLSISYFIMKKSETSHKNEEDAVPPKE
jgi:uncharacterized membrane protein YqhA